MQCIAGYALVVWCMAVLQHPACSSLVHHRVRLVKGRSLFFVSAPYEASDGSEVQLRSNCSEPCHVTLELVVSTSADTQVLVFQKTWTTKRQDRLGSDRIHRTRLRLPPSLVFRRGFFNRHIVDGRFGFLRAWLASSKGSSDSGSYEGSEERTAVVLRVVPASQRPPRPPTGCPSWSAELLWTRTVTSHQCPHGTDVEHLLKFPAVSTGERFGLVRTLRRFPARDMEDQRRHAVSQPRVTLSVWVYLLEWCQSKLCGIVTHISRKQEFDSMLMLLTDTGGLVIQTRLTSGEDRSFHAHASLPLLTWIRLDCSVRRTEVKLEITWKNHSQTHTYRFPTDVRYNDTDGYFMIGGSLYLPGIYGYFGPIVFYRLGTTRVENPLPPGNMLERLSREHRHCRRISTFTHAFSEAVMSGDPVLPRGVCSSYYVTLWRRSHQHKCYQTWTWREQQNYKTLFHFLRRSEEDTTSGPWGGKDLGSHLFDYVAKRMFSVDNTQFILSPSLRALLQASCCLGNRHAPLLLATVYLSGLGHPVDHEKGHVYSLMGALADHRLALMHLGYKHSQGLDGFPKDLEIAYSCYANSATQTIFDDDRPHENHQHMVVDVHLDNKEQLRAMDQGAKDVADFLKLKAESGDVESQKQLASMSFWGQNGVSKDVASAARWYRKVALRMNDASAIYDYAILLMKGQGVKHNLTESMRLLEKAIEMGSVEALNAVGWYHSSVKRNVSAAVAYFQRAAVNGSRDAMYNLGLYHLNGQHPDDLGRNQTAAFRCFLNASQSGHASASVAVARYLATGELGGVARDVELAVRKLKKVSERNGHLGYTLRKALKAYLRGSRAEALVGYVLAAESGLGLAQANSAHLCEEMSFTPECQWRYRNYSVLNYDPHQSGLLKMGDYYYYNFASSGENYSSLIGQAISMYSQAASAGSPQGCFSLVMMAQDGHILPLGVRRQFNVSAHAQPEILLEKILQRCVEMEPEGTITPCSLALLRLSLDRAWKKMAQNAAEIYLTYVALLSLFAVAMVIPIQAVLDGRMTPCAGRRGQAGWTPRVDLTGPAPPATLDPAGTGVTRTLGLQALRRKTEVVFSVSGVLLCVYIATLLHHVL